MTLAEPLEKLGGIGAEGMVAACPTSCSEPFTHSLLKAA